MSQFRFEVTQDEDRENRLIERLRSFNRANSPAWEENWNVARDPMPLHIFVSSQEGDLVGGLIGRTNAIRSWLEVTLIWVDPECRGTGLGRELLIRAEEEAKSRGCAFARLATGSYQAPGFYVKCGYVEYGRLEDCPPGETVFYFRKTF